MRQFIAQFKLTGRQWLALACVAGMFGLIAWLSFRQQRLEYGRDLDVKIEAAIRRADHERDRLMAEIDELRAKDRKADEEREALSKTVDQIKSEVKRP